MQSAKKGVSACGCGREAVSSKTGYKLQIPAFVLTSHILLCKKERKLQQQ